LDVEGGLHGAEAGSGEVGLGCGAVATGCEGVGQEVHVDGGADLVVQQRTPDATGLFTGRVSRHYEPEDKVTFVAEQCQRLGVGLDQVVAIGDGRSDLPLFHSVGFSVAINASSEARAAASATVDSQSFLDALTAVPGLLDQPTR